MKKLILAILMLQATFAFVACDGKATVTSGAAPVSAAKETFVGTEEDFGGCKIIQMNEETWRVENGIVRFFVLTGKNEALLIDTGYNAESAKAIAEHLTSLPIRLLNTHADPDHTARNDEFDKTLMNPAEASNYYKTSRRGDKRAAIEAIWDGTTIDLGGRHLEIITTPGHTPGSVAILDKKYRIIFTGDPIQENGDIVMVGTQREIHAWKHGLEKVKARAKDFDDIYPSHGNIPIKAAVIDGLLEGMEKVMAGEIQPESVTAMGGPAQKYDLGVSRILLDADFDISKN